MNIKKPLFIWTALLFSSLATGQDIWTAVKEGDTKKLASFLEEGSSPNLRNKQGWTLLHIASMFGHLETVLLLIDKGAKVTATGHNGSTPLFYSIVFNNPKVSALLEEHGAQLTVLDSLMLKQTVRDSQRINKPLAGITPNVIRQIQSRLRELNDQNSFLTESLEIEEYKNGFNCKKTFFQTDT